MTEHEEPIEDRLAAALRLADDAADRDAGAPVPDRGDLSRRIARTGARRRRLASVAAVLVLVAAVGGGWAVGRAGSDDDDGRGRASQQAGSAEQADAADAADAAEEVGRTAGDEGGDGSEAALAAVDLPVVPGPRATTRSAGVGQSAPAADDAAFQSEATGWSGPGPIDQPSGRLFQRALDDGTTFDVRANRYAEGTGYEDRPWWDPPAWCFPSGALYVGVRGPASVGQVRSLRYDEVRPSTLTVATGVIGVAEREPRWVVVSQVPAGTTRVTATFPDGRTDEVEPVGGIAVLSTRLADGFDLDRLTASGDASNPELLDATTPSAGARLRVTARGSDGATAAYDGGWSGTSGFVVADDGTSARIPYGEPACTAPSTLPAPGSEQPADPAAARAGVEAAWAEAFTVEGDLTAAADAIDDPRGIEVARERLLAAFPGEAVTAGTVTVDELVFADAGTAYVRYTVLVPDRAFTAAGLFGEARVVDGAWRVTRATVCDVFALGGGRCPPVP